MAEFFQECSAIDSYEVIDFVLHRYHDINFLFDLPFREGLKVIAEGMKKTDEDRLWQQYCEIYPHLSQENFVTFNQFKEKCTKKPEPPKCKAEIMKNVKDIINLTL